MFTFEWLLIELNAIEINEATWQSLKCKSTAAHLLVR